MSFRARSYQRIPARTVLMLIQDRLDVVFKDEEFDDLGHSPESWTP